MAAKRPRPSETLGGDAVFARPPCRNCSAQLALERPHVRKAFLTITLKPALDDVCYGGRDTELTQRSQGFLADRDEQSRKVW